MLEFRRDRAESSRVQVSTKSADFQCFVWYGPALVSGPRTRSAAQLAGAALALVLAGVSAAGAAGPGDSLRRQTRELNTQAERAVLTLYALDSRVHAAHARVVALVSEAAALHRAQAQLAQQLAATRTTLSVSQHELATNLSVLYKQDGVSALAVVLGAKTLDDAFARIDDLNRVADQSAQVVVVARNARVRLDRLRSTLAARRAQLTAAVLAAQQTESVLESTRVRRVSYIASLRRQRQLKVAQIQRLETTAERVVKKSATIQAAAAPPAATSPVAAAAELGPPGARTITVSSTGYSLSGRTATGLPVGWGVVAVDPSVIPLGSRLTIPGYGDAVAADTGGAVRGDMIDLWFPSLAAARAWGRRTITITLH